MLNLIYKKWNELDQSHKNFIHPISSHPMSSSRKQILDYHKVLDWNKENNIYILPLQDMHSGSFLLTDNQIRQILKSVGKALKTMHKRGICHGLVIPDNILIDK